MAHLPGGAPFPMPFAGIRRPEEFRTVTRAHLIAWRDELGRRGLGGAAIRHRLASLASLFEYLGEKNAIAHKPVKGVERPETESGEGKTPAIGDHQARDLLAARGPRIARRSPIMACTLRTIFSSCKACRRTRCRPAGLRPLVSRDRR
jgi:hypothetical protein